jgi:pimeloyl-ACP methyl ester carboxylesterase
MTAALTSLSHDGLAFEVSDSGTSGQRILIALHGFPQDRSCWDSLTQRISQSGVRVLAPDQRGYSPAARPKQRRAYLRSSLRGDVIALADAVGAERFDLLGHDLGGVVAWDLAGRHPERVRSLTVLSTPHPTAFRRALFRGGQATRSWYMVAFQVPYAAEALARAAGVERLTQTLARDGLDHGSAHRYATRLCSPPACAGCLAWYRAMPFDKGGSIPSVRVPTVYIWGANDRYVAPAAATATADSVVGRFRLEVLADSGHWLPEMDAAKVGPILLENLAATA